MDKNLYLTVTFRSKIKDFEINRPSGSINVEFHTADAALMWIEYWSKKAPTTAFTIELIGSNASNNSKIKAKLVSINNTLRRGGKINETTRTQLYDVIKFAVKNDGIFKTDEFSDGEVVFDAVYTTVEQRTFFF